MIVTQKHGSRMAKHHEVIIVEQRSHALLLKYLEISWNENILLQAQERGAFYCGTQMLTNDSLSFWGGSS